MSKIKVLFFLFLFFASSGAFGQSVSRDTFRASYYIRIDGADKMFEAPATIIFDSSFVFISFGSEQVLKTVVDISESLEGETILSFRCGEGLRLTTNRKGIIDGIFVRLRHRNKSRRSFYFGK